MLRVIRIASMLLLATMVFPACDTQSGTQATSQSAAQSALQISPQPTTPPRGGTLTRAMNAEPTDFDPQGPANSGLNLVLPYLFDTLIARQRDGKFVSLLAENWSQSQDGKVVEFKLKSGVKFHDGSPLNADAVVFTFERFKQVGSKSPIAGDINGISRVEAVDPMTVRFTFAAPTATTLNTLAQPYAAILSPSAVKAAGDQMGLKPVGTGAFKLAEWVKGVSITLVRNPDYNWGSPETKNRGPVYVDKMVLKPVPDAATQLAGLKAGDVDVIFTNDPEQINLLRNDKGFTVIDADMDALIYLGYNCAKAPFDELKVRQALSYAVNKQEIIKVALGGIGVEALTPLAPRMLGYNAELKAYGQGFDPAKSRMLLTEAGFTQSTDGSWQRDGKKLTAKLLTSNRAPNDAIATILQSEFKTIGVPIEIQQLDSSAAMQASTEGSFDLILWRYDWSEPDALNTYLSTSRIKQTNRVFYSNPKVDDLLNRAGAEFDDAKRSSLYQDAQKIILTEAPWQPLYIPIEALAARSRVKGLVVTTLGRLLVNDVTLVGN